MAPSQHRETVEIPARRGTIFDRIGRPLAIGEQATTVYADPRQIREPARGRARRGPRSSGSPTRTSSPLASPTASKGFVYVARKADPARRRALEKRGLPGLGFYPEERRSYPQRSVAAHVLGYAGVDNRGLAGLERSLDARARGRGRAARRSSATPSARSIEVVRSVPEREGRDVFLTLDHGIQANAEAVLRETVRHVAREERVGDRARPDERVRSWPWPSRPGFDANSFGSVPWRARATAP